MERVAAGGHPPQNRRPYGPPSVGACKQLTVIIFSEGHPQLITCDFEQAVWNAATAVAPKAAVGGCLFHLYRAIDHNVDAKDLRSIKNNSQTFAHIIRMLKTLAFFPPSEVYNGYMEVLGFFDEKLKVNCFCLS